MFPAAAGFRVMLHLLNTSSDPVSAHIDFGMNTVDPDAVAKKAAAMFLNNLGLKVPIGTSTAQGVFTLPGDIMLMRAVSHMHRHGSGFVANTDTGVELYRSTVWDEPVPRVFDPPLSLAKGTKITWSCDFQNDSGSTLIFGESAAKNEMCIFSASFYDALGYQLNAQYPFF